MVLRSVDVLSCGKIMGALYAVLGLIGGLFFAVVSMAGAMLSQPPANGPNPAAVAVGMGVVIAVVAPIFYGVLALLFGLLPASVYNFLAGLNGGLELHFEYRITEAAPRA